ECFLRIRLDAAFAVMIFRERLAGEAGRQCDDERKCNLLHDVPTLSDCCSGDAVRNWSDGLLYEEDRMQDNRCLSTTNFVLRQLVQRDGQKMTNSAHLSRFNAGRIRRTNPTRKRQQ